MAIIKRSALGKMTGKVGDVVIQNRFQQRVVSVRPEHYVTVSEKVKNERKKFGFKVYFAKCINKNSLLRMTWKYSNLNRISNYHKIFSYNSRLIKNDMPGPANCVTPNLEAGRNIPRVGTLGFKHEFTGDSIKFSYRITADEGAVFEAPYTAVVTFFLFNPGGDDENYWHFILHKSVGAEDVNKDGVTEFEMMLNEKQKEKMRIYGLMRGYFAMVKGNKSRSDVENFSETVYFEEEI